MIPARSADIPAGVRAEVLTRARRRCEDCSCATRLEMHHLRYWDQGLPIFGQETADDVEALCRDCHLHRHIDPNGQFWADPAEMEEQWEAYHWAMDKP